MPCRRCYNLKTLPKTEDKVIECLLSQQPAESCKAIMYTHVWYTSHAQSILLYTPYYPTTAQLLIVHSANLIAGKAPMHGTSMLLVKSCGLHQRSTASGSCAHNACAP